MVRANYNTFVVLRHDCSYFEMFGANSLMKVRASFGIQLHVLPGCSRCGVLDRLAAYRPSHAIRIAILVKSYV